MWPAWRGWCTPARATALRGSFRHELDAPPLRGSLPPKGGPSSALADVPPQPWKNGGGTTRELLAWPEAASWRVRLSVAEVAADGPFSRFEGVQRWFAVLQGAGCAGGGPASHPVGHRRANRWPLTGPPRPQCTLLGGPTQDFNLMLRGAGNVAAPLGCDRSGTVDATNLIAVYATSARAVVRFGLETCLLEPGTPVLAPLPMRHPGWRCGATTCFGPCGWRTHHDPELWTGARLATLQTELPPRPMAWSTTARWWWREAHCLGGPAASLPRRMMRTQCTTPRRPGRAHHARPDRLPHPPGVRRVTAPASSSCGSTAPATKTLPAQAAASRPPCAPRALPAPQSCWRKACRACRHAAPRV
jgi:environmental stress-induced protein Ves